jgi:hypothetical protein
MDLDRRFDQCAFLTAHNAFAYPSAGFTYYMQNDDFPGQLALGTRAFMLDIYRYTQDGVTDIYLCHGSPEYGDLKDLQHLGDYQTFSSALAQIKDFLDDNPQEVVTLLLECGKDLAKDGLLDRAFAAGGVESCLFLPGETWDVEGQGWPTLRWMIEQGKRLIVMTDRTDTGLPYQWDFATENNYGDESMDPDNWAEPRAESAPLDDPTKALFIMNHFPDMGDVLDSDTITTELLNDLLKKLIGSAQTDNSLSSLQSQIAACLANAGRYPNFIAVNFVDVDNGDLNRCVQRLNDNGLPGGFYRPVCYNDTVRLRSASDGYYLCYSATEKAFIKAEPPVDGNPNQAPGADRFKIYNYHWDETSAIQYLGSKDGAEHLTSAGNFRLSCEEIDSDRTIVAPDYNAGKSDSSYAALFANTDRDGADNYETFFFVNARDTSSSGHVMYGDRVRVMNFAKSQPFLRHDGEGYVRCIDGWPGQDDFIVEQVDGGGLL